MSTRRPPLRLAITSPIADIFETPLSSGLYGFVRLDVFPFRIVLNSKVLSPRQATALVHEMLHVFFKMHKRERPLPHIELHNLACLIREELLPYLDSVGFDLALFSQVIRNWARGHRVRFTDGELYDLSRFVWLNIHPVFKQYARIKEKTNGFDLSGSREGEPADGRRTRERAAR